MGAACYVWIGPKGPWSPPSWSTSRQQQETPLSSVTSRPALEIGTAVWSWPLTPLQPTSRSSATTPLLPMCAFTVWRPGKICTFFCSDSESATLRSVKGHTISAIHNSDSCWLDNCTLLGHYTASSGNNPEECSSHLLRGGRPKSRMNADSVFGLYYETPWFLLYSFHGYFTENLMNLETLPYKNATQHQMRRRSRC